MDNLRDLIFDLFKKMNDEEVNVKNFIDSLVEEGKLRQDEILGFRMRIYNIIKGKITNLKDYIKVVSSNPLIIRLNSKYSEDELDKIWNEAGFMVKRKNKIKKYSELVKEVRNTILNSEFKKILSKSDVIPWEDMSDDDKLRYSMEIIKSTLFSHDLSKIILTNNLDVFNTEILDPKKYVIYFDDSMIHIKDKFISILEDIISKNNIRIEIINLLN